MSTTTVPVDYHAPKYTVHDFARRNGLQSQTVYYWLCSKKYVIPHHRIGKAIRFSQADLDAFARPQVSPVA